MTDEKKSGTQAGSGSGSGFGGTDTATLVRDAVTLQVKLVIDGLRDAVLIPLSLLAALISLVQPGADRGRFFYDIVRMGRRSERWINLFAAADRIHPDEDETGDAAEFDDYLAQVERRLTKELRDGEVKDSAGRAVDALLERIRKARSGFHKRDSQ